MPHQQQQMYDLQSDTSTTPTDEMFEIMKLASRGDDVFSVRNLIKYMFVKLIINIRKIQVSTILNHMLQIF